MNITKFASALLIAVAQISLSPAQATGGSWTSHPVINSEGCNNLEYPEVGEFLQTHYYPSLSYSDNQEESGRQMLANYGIASALVNRSQICLADALELQELSEKLKEQTAILTSGTSMSKQQMEKQRTLTADANSEIEAAAARVEDLSPEQRKRFGNGTAAYLAGTYATGQLFRSVDEYMIETKNDIAFTSKPKSNAGGFAGLANLTKDLNNLVGAVGKANDAGQVMAGLKNHVGSLYETSQFLSAYSKEKEIELPTDATDQLAEVSDWV